MRKSLALKLIHGLTYIVFLVFGLESYKMVGYAKKNQ
jgi:hypothetical protein